MSGSPSDTILEAPWPEAMSPAAAEREDAWGDALLEARACGDVGFADRMWGAGRVLDAGFDELDAELARHAPLGGADEVAADPMEREGVVGWLGLAARTRNQSDARLLSAVHLIGHHDGLVDAGGRPVRDADAADEVGAAMGWSRSMATSWLTLADAVIDRMPRLYEAMAAGELEMGKARVIAEYTRAMPADLAAMVAAGVVAAAPGVSHSELGLRLDVAAGELDPDWVARREAAARARLRVQRRRTPEGTADVGLRDLGAEAAARINARIDALAGELRRAALADGHDPQEVTTARMRALVSQRLWDGTHTALDDSALLVALLADLPAWLHDLHGHHEPDGPDDSSGPDGPNGPDGPDGPDDDSGPAPDSGPDAGGRGVRVGTVELRLRLTTALGLDDLPARLAGQGVLGAAGARRMLQRIDGESTPVECRLLLVDADGHLEHVVLVPFEPHAARPSRGSPDARGRVIVELAVPVSVFDALDPDRYPPWTRWLQRARKQWAQLRAAHPHEAERHPATSTRDADRRLPGRALARWIRARDGGCVGPVCDSAAHHGEIDHTRDWADRGRTLAANLGVLCGRCHRLKHRGGWRLTQPAPGRFRWRTRLGAEHTVEPRPVLEPPAQPAPARRPRPILGAPRTPRTDPDGWITDPPPGAAPAPVPAPPRQSAAPSPPTAYDGPPPF